jgi:hypothetical protein
LRVGDRYFSFDPRRVLQLVHHVPVSRQRQPGIVPELVGDVDDVAAFVQEQRGEAVPQVVRARVCETSCLRRTLERAPAPRLVRGLRPRLAIAAWKHELVVIGMACGHPPQAQIRSEPR